MEDVATETYTYATFWQRLGAHFVDAMIIVPIGFLTMWLAPRVGDAWIALWVGMSIAMSLYDPLMHRRFGQTVGKMVAKIQVHQANAQPIEWKHAWRRSSVNLLLFCSPR